jgi:HlyD family secretion protein
MTTTTIEGAAPIGDARPGAPADDARRARDRRRATARRARRGGLVVLGLLVLVGLGLALRPRPVPVEVTAVARAPLTVTIEESGVARVPTQQRFVVSAPVAGTLLRPALEVGDTVAQGAPVARIAPLPTPLLDPAGRAQAEARVAAALSAEGQARAALGRAKTAVAQADQELERTRRLTETGAFTRQALERAEFDARLRQDELAAASFAARVAAEEVRFARAALGRARSGASGAPLDLRAPLPGQVLRLHQRSEGVVQAGTPLLEIGDPAALEVVVDLLTTDAVHVRPGTPARLRDWGGPTIAARVHRIEPSAFTQTSALGVDEQRVNVVLTIDEPRDRWTALGDGYRVQVELVLEEVPDAATVPLGAVFRSGADWAVYRIDEGVARLTPVEVGRRAQARVEIRGGLAPGAAVIVHPGDRVRDGVRVAAR